MQVLGNMDKTIATNGMELVNALERTVTLGLIDDAWKEHLRAMDDLKQSVQTATYEQKDPLVIYKVEAFNLFSNMSGEVNKNIVEFLSHAMIPLEEGDQVKEGKQQKTDLSKMKINKDEIDAAGQEYGANEKDYLDPTPVKQTPIVVGPKIGRNDPCPCGSGKKYKACHGREE
jgi:preprotein translocase subunit SecA